jgi:hypothetical protein
MTSRTAPWWSGQLSIFGANLDYMRYNRSWPRSLINPLMVNEPSSTLLPKKNKARNKTAGVLSEE